MEIYEGVKLNGGMVMGKILYYCGREENFYAETKEDSEAELALLEQGIAKVSEKLDAEASGEQKAGNQTDADVAHARKMLLKDIVDEGGCRTLISEKKYSARRAVLEAGSKYRLAFQNLPDDSMRERSVDIQKVTEELLKVLNGKKRTFPKLEEPVIIVADEIIAEEDLCFQKDFIRALVICNESPYSDTAVLTQLWRIPALAGIPAKEEWNGRLAVVDADSRSLFIDPDDMVKNLAMFRESMSAQADILDWGLDMLTDDFF